MPSEILPTLFGCHQEFLLDTLKRMVSCFEQFGIKTFKLVAVINFTRVSDSIAILIFKPIGISMSIIDNWYSENIGSIGLDLGIQGCLKNSDLLSSCGTVRRCRSCRCDWATLFFLHRFCLRTHRRLWLLCRTGWLRQGNSEY